MASLTMEAEAEVEEVERVLHEVGSEEERLVEAFGDSRMNATKMDAHGVLFRVCEVSKQGKIWPLGRNSRCHHSHMGREISIKCRSCRLLGRITTAFRAGGCAGSARSLSA